MSWKKAATDHQHKDRIGGLREWTFEAGIQEGYDTATRKEAKICKPNTLENARKGPGSDKRQ